MGLIKKIFDTTSEKEIRRIIPIVDEIEALDESYKKLSTEELKGKTKEFRERLANGETLDDILPEAFATVREASSRVLGLKHYRVQLIGGIILHQGRIAEMRTGEGKTLVATLPAYLNALAGNGVHIVTVNDYLAKRDSEWMGKLYRYLGLSVGLIIHGIDPALKKSMYEADITYGTNNEFGFDYLRDNMAIYKEAIMQRGHAFAIVDEVDSILIDEARTPLIISGQGEESTEMYNIADRFVRTLKMAKFKELDEKESHDDIDADYIVDEKAKSVSLTPRGVEKAEKEFQVEGILTDGNNSTLLHHINQALRAHGIMRRDVDYIIKDGAIIIVDEFTGRLMYGRRYSNGLHQAIEAKERVQVLRENKTLATITFQNYFRLYQKLSGMTGTAMTEEEEFTHIYALDVVEIPTNKPSCRQDDPDIVYKTEAGKFRAVIERIKLAHEKHQPVLVGTISIEKSERLSKMLRKEGIAHNVLNAQHHAREAEIVAQAGKYDAVTIATNMAGRGTDIMLGGNPDYMARQELVKAGYTDEVIAEATGYADTDNADVLSARKQYYDDIARFSETTQAEARQVTDAGGLLIIGTERHESRRIDNQLRGRSGRQGDPGETVFYLSLEDDVMRLFGASRAMGMLETLGFDEDTPIEHKMLSNAIETAQRRVESQNFQMRKHVLEYDDVMNRQREIIYEERQKVLDGADIKDSILKMIHETIEREVRSQSDGHDYMDTWQAEAAIRHFEGLFLKPDSLSFTKDELNTMDLKDITDAIEERALEAYENKEASLGSPLMREFERVIMLKNVDANWIDHIDAMDELKRGIGLRAYAQVDPVIAFKQEGFDMFDEMIANIRENTVEDIFKLTPRRNEEPERKQIAKETATSGASDGTLKQQPVKKEKKPGRNDPCPCGSGLKYKKCCGKND